MRSNRRLLVNCAIILLLLHRVPNERSRVDARALGRGEWFLEKWPSGKFCWCLYREVDLKVRRATFLNGFTIQAPASHSSFLTWIKVVFWDGRPLATCWVRSHGSCDIEHAAAPGSVLRASKSSNASSGLPGPPAGSRGKDGRIHNDSSQHSTAAQREVASLCLYTYCHHFLYISILRWRGGGGALSEEADRGIWAPCLRTPKLGSRVVPMVLC